MGRWGIGEAEGTTDVRADLSLAVPDQDLIEPPHEHLSLIPYVAQGVRQRERIYLEPRDRGEGLEGGKSGIATDAS